MAGNTGYGSNGYNGQPQGGSGYRYQYGNGNGMGGGQRMPPQRPKNSKDWEWVVMAILFLMPTFLTKVIAVIWFIRKIKSLNAAEKSAYRNQARNAADQVKDAFVDMGHGIADDIRNIQERQSQRQNMSQDQNQNQNQGYQYRQGVDLGKKQGEGIYQNQPQSQMPQYTQGRSTNQNQVQGAYRRSQQQAQQPIAEEKKEKKGWFDRSKALQKIREFTAGGTGMTIGGGLMAGLFSISSIGLLSEVIDGIQYGFLDSASVAGMIVSILLTAAGAGLLYVGQKKKRQADRFMNYLGYIGTNQEVPLANMAASFGVPVKTLCEDIRVMLAKGVLPVGYLDLAEGKLFLTESGYHSNPATPKPEAKAEEPSKAETPSDAQKAEQEEDEILRQIQEVNAQIPDASMSMKIDRIEEITRRILAYQKAHPNREAQLRSFLNYYLPTTLKILRAYAQLDAQGVEGENISNAKKRIEGMMDQVVAGYEKQLDMLFRDDALDIAADVEVLENMLRKDGLANDGMNMPFPS